jgi:von Willebrand factor A domain-containing protein 8
LEGSQNQAGKTFPSSTCEGDCSLISRQVSDELKNAVPDDIKKKAQELAREELNRRLEELNMSPGDAKAYGALLTAVQAHIASLLDLLERVFPSSLRIRAMLKLLRIDLAAREEERVWVKWQTDGELDDSRLTEGLTGETTVYKRRGTEKPEMGRPQMK